MDVWVDRSSENASLVWRALETFGAPAAALGIRQSDLETADVVVQIGLPPRRIDVLTGVTGVDFDDAWAGRVVHQVEELDVPFLGREALIQNKRATGRLKDLGDLEALGEEPGS